MLAVLYDVHGNLPALEAVLDDARSAGAGGYVLGGDYAAFGGWPAETVARLRELPGATWVRGNVDRWTAAPGDAPDDPVIQAALAACAEALGREVAGELAALPDRASMADTEIVHGSPVSDVLSFGPQPAETDADLLAGLTPPLLLFGHTHVPFARSHGPTRLVNPGSVGIPLDGDHRAAYALLHPDGAIEHRRVAYDHAASAAQVRALGEWGRTFAGRIERAAL